MLGLVILNLGFNILILRFIILGYITFQFHNTNILIIRFNILEFNIVILRFIILILGFMILIIGFILISRFILLILGFIIKVSSTIINHSCLYLARLMFINYVQP